MQISEQHVRECAYYIWEKEGRIHGHAVAHWMRAEAELRSLHRGLRALLDEKRPREGRRRIPVHPTTHAGLGLARTVEMTASDNEEPEPAET